MTRGDAEAALSAAGAEPEARFPLYEAAIACALHEDAGRDGDGARRMADAAADRLARRLSRQRPDDALGDALYGDLGLNGDALTPEDPGNVDLLAVCARRCGVSIALGLVYLEAARRAGVDAKGVDFPGHFLLRVETHEGPVALDPFIGGRVVLPSELTRRALAAGLTPQVADRLDALMAPVDARSVVVRLQSLVFARAVRARDFEAAERAALRRGLLDPNDHRPWLDVAAAREGQGRLAGALEALGRARALAGPAAAVVEAAGARLRRRLN